MGGTIGKTSAALDLAITTVAAAVILIWSENGITETQEGTPSALGCRPIADLHWTGKVPANPRSRLAAV